MALPKEKVQRISQQVIKVLSSRFESFPEDATNNRNAPFHKAFLNAFSDKLNGKVTDVPFFISLSSWLHGLNTTMGQTFFEVVAHILCDGEKREYTNKKEGNLQIEEAQKENISSIITHLSNAAAHPDLNAENLQIFINTGTALVNALDFSADVFIDDGTQIIAIEMKSVRPNSGEMRGEKEKILEGKAALHKAFPGKPVKFFIGFPFDPTNAASATGYDKARFMASIINMNKYFASSEVLLAAELWDFLSGDNETMDQLLAIINAIATPKFHENCEFLNNHQNRLDHTAEYRKLLKTWNLFTEVDLLDNEEDIRAKIADSKSQTKVFNQRVIKNGAYNVDRCSTLNALV